MTTHFYVDAQGNPINLTGGGVEESSVAAVADTIARRDTAGRLKAAPPARDADLCTRGYTRQCWTAIDQRVSLSPKWSTTSQGSVISQVVKSPVDGWVFAHGFEFQPFLDVLVYDDSSDGLVTVFRNRSLQYYTTPPTTGGYYHYSVSPVRAGQWVRLQIEHLRNVGQVLWQIISSYGVKT